MQIILLLLLILAILLMFLSKKNSFTKRTKIYIIISLALVFTAGWLFTIYNQNIAKNEREIINAYQQGKTLTCGNYKVNISSFVFVSGTFSFIARDDKKELKGIVIDISTCKK